MHLSFPSGIIMRHLLCVQGLQLYADAGTAPPWPMIALIGRKREGQRRLGNPENSPTVSRAPHWAVRERLVFSGNADSSETWRCTYFATITNLFDLVYPTFAFFFPSIFGFEAAAPKTPIHAS